MTTIDQLTAIIKDVTKNPNIIITTTTTAPDVEGWDSLSHIYIIAEVEDTFNIRLTAQEGASIKSVGDLISLIDSKR